MTQYFAVAEGVDCLSFLEQLATLAINERVDASIILGSIPPKSDGDISLNKLCSVEQPSLMLYMTKYVKQFCDTQKKLAEQL